MSVSRRLPTETSRFPAPSPRDGNATEQLWRHALQDDRVHRCRAQVQRMRRDQISAEFKTSDRSSSAVRSGPAPGVKSRIAGLTRRHFARAIARAKFASFAIASERGIKSCAVAK